MQVAGRPRYGLLKRGGPRDDWLHRQASREIGLAQRSAGELPSDALLSVVLSSGKKHGQVIGPSARQYRPYGTKCLSLAQATNIIEAVGYAREVARPLVAHATIHWTV